MVEDLCWISNYVIHLLTHGFVDTVDMVNVNDVLEDDEAILVKGGKDFANGFEAVRAGFALLVGGKDGFWSIHDLFLVDWGTTDHDDEIAVGAWFGIW